MDYHHDAGRQAKYLETPFNSGSFRSAKDRMIAEEIKREL